MAGLGWTDTDINTKSKTESISKSKQFEFFMKNTQKIIWILICLVIAQWIAIIIIAVSYRPIKGEELVESLHVPLSTRYVPLDDLQPGHWCWVPLNQSEPKLLCDIAMPPNCTGTMYLQWDNEQKMFLCN